MSGNANRPERAPSVDVTDGERVEAPCSVCGRPVVAALRPFCSRRCADVDLGRWLSGSYAIAGEDGDADDGGAAGQEPGSFL